jgi:hypothetical protein
VHWDSKLLPDLTRKDTIDHLLVIITALNVEQLLRVPQLPSGNGNKICSAVYNTLNDWCLLDQVEDFVFDTTASNSGRLNGACVLLEQKLNRFYFLLVVTIFLKSFYKLFLLHQNYLLSLDLIFYCLNDLKITGRI